jgi:GAF domain-containing protein
VPAGAETLERAGSPVAARRLRNDRSARARGLVTEMASRWLSASVDADPIERARLLRRAREAVFTGQGRPQILRDIVIDSWLRSARAGVDPTRPAPKIISETEAADRLSSHRLAGIVPIVRSMLGGVARDARHIVVISDATGMLLSAEGHPEMLEAAATTHFVPGALLSETATGTNAVGTTLYLDHPLQIFSAEHFNSLFHGWTCSAAPIHDPSSGALLGAIDLSGNFRTVHPHSVSLVTAVARLVETRLALDAVRRDAYLRDRYLALVMRDSRRPSALVTTSGRVVVSSPPSWLGEAVAVPPGTDRFTLPSGDEVAVEALEKGDAVVLWKVDHGRATASRPKLRILALGRRRAALEQIGGTVELSPRHSEILTLLALHHPEGLTGEELAFEIYGANVRAVTIRAEMSRLRRLLGCLLLANPYRLLADVDADFVDVERLIGAGDLTAAARAYRGPLLARSTVPGIVRARERLERALRPNPVVRRRRRPPVAAVAQAPECREGVATSALRTPTAELGACSPTNGIRRG